MELVLEICSPYSSNIEAKCLARNEKKAMDVLKQAMDELQKAKHRMLEKNYNELFNKYTEVFNTIKNKHVSEDKAENSHLQHDVYKTAEGLYVNTGHPESFLVREGIYLKQNKAICDAKKLVDEGDDAIIAAIRIAKDANSAALEQENEDYPQKLNEDRAAFNKKETPYDEKISEEGQAHIDINLNGDSSNYHNSLCHT